MPVPLGADAPASALTGLLDPLEKMGACARVNLGKEGVRWNGRKLFHGIQWDRLRPVKADRLPQARRVYASGNARLDASTADTRAGCSSSSPAPRA